MSETRYLTFALGKGRLANKTLELFEKIGITCEEIYDKNTRRQIVFTAPTARVLIVDDSKVNLGVAKGLLEEYETFKQILGTYDMAWETKLLAGDTKLKKKF